MEQRSAGRMVARDISSFLAKLPPSAIELEESVLGALMLESAAMPVVSSFLKPEHFYKESHMEIYMAIFNLFSVGEPIDMRTVVAQLRKSGKLEVVGGAYYIAELTSKVSSAANIEYHARIIIEMAIKRELIVIASEIHAKAYDDTTDVFDLKDFASQKIEELSDDTSQTANEKSVLEISTDVIFELQNRIKGDLSGIPSGFEEVDKILNGYQNGNLILIGGRPGQGKSALAFQSLYHIAHDLKIPVGAFSLEMPSKQVISRLACGVAEIDSDKVKSPKTLTEYEFKRILDAHGEISKCVYRIDDSPALHISEIRSRAKRMVQKFGVRIILVDYAQLIRGMLHGERLTRDQEIGVISRGLKAIAKENNIPVIAICSLSREVEKRGGDKRPQLHDLRDGGSLESDADVVGFIYRPETYKITQDADGFSTHGLTEFIVAKHRDGGTGTAKLKFVGKFTKFSPWISEYQPPSISQRQEYAEKHYKNPIEEYHKQGPDAADDNPF